ncbi:hypothetical protein FPQ18DRAFT_343286 [Pyronema domesticum]|uniref:Uncharacterized protein n=1 Tax=Pyronema omphalodes (strain CBS 100304) TaxID=1076935 RepID=U4LKT2_PYROM|nr:hypothetical protein FPQ18DRAFT_343286 [Pyronema domesticum]CCX29970.1 Protein of unknown function [Pyronema omphalodes CBS 100304]
MLRSPSPTNHDLTSNSFLEQPVEDLVLLHSVNSLLALVSLPTLHNILDATPYLLILLYEALSPPKRVPFVKRKHSNADFGTRLRNLKLLVGTIAHDEDLHLSRNASRRLAELDLAGFCEKDTDATRSLLTLMVEVLDSLRPQQTKLLEQSVRGGLNQVLRETRPEGVPEELLDEISAGIADLLPQSGPKLAAPGEDSDEDSADDNGSESSWAAPQYRHMQLPIPPTLLPLPPSRTASPASHAVQDEVDESDISLLPLPPSPPSKSQYLSMKGSSFLSRRSESIPTSGTTLRPPRSIPGSSPGSRRHSLMSRSPKPTKKLLGTSTAGSGDETDRTSQMSVSPASWGADSDYTAQLRRKRDEALERLRLAEERFQRQVDKKATAAPVNDYDDSHKSEHTWRSSRSGSIIGYGDVEEELDAVQQDGTVQVEKLEELVKTLLVRRGYRVSRQ